MAEPSRLWLRTGWTGELYRPVVALAYRAGMALPLDSATHHSNIPPYPRRLSVHAEVNTPPRKNDFVDQ